jgi:hypothetical protein
MFAWKLMMGLQCERKGRAVVVIEGPVTLVGSWKLLRWMG